MTLPGRGLKICGENLPDCYKQATRLFEYKNIKTLFLPNIYDRYKNIVRTGS